MVPVRQPYRSLGVKREHILMCDSRGVIYEGRPGLNAEKQEFAVRTEVRTLEEALRGADVFLGLSVADILTEEMVQSMAKDPIVFALANPNPEISYEKAMHSRPDIIFATGRSDYPNQINNVLGFPYIFRGALDVQATSINEEMKLAAAYAIADLTKQPVPESVKMAYHDPAISFDRNYIIPKALDNRLISCVAPAVAKAAIESGVARKTIEDWEAYREGLEHRVSHDNGLMRLMTHKAKANPKRRAHRFPDSDRGQGCHSGQDCQEQVVYSRGGDIRPGSGDGEDGALHCLLLREDATPGSFHEQSQAPDARPQLRGFDDAGVR